MKWVRQFFLSPREEKRRFHLLQIVVIAAGGLLLCRTDAWCAPASISDERFEVWIEQQARLCWEKRDEGIAALKSAPAILARKESARKTFLDLLGGLPSEKTPLNAQNTGEIVRDGYRIERVIFESQPGFKVTANLYVPTSLPGPFPAVVGLAGHSAQSKAAETYQRAFIAFARQGFVVLAFDPAGQGERLDCYEETLGRSSVGAGVPEHNLRGLQCLLIGQTLARYLVWDGIRAIDYLLTRPEVDPRRIAVAGNSGGGTQAAYLGLADPRVSAVISSCYLTRWRELWSQPGPQDAEQVLPGFLARGLDFGDFPLGVAPTPFLISAATRDFFPIAGARAMFVQTQRLYGLLERKEALEFFEHDDTHGWSQPRRQAATRFLVKWLQQRETDGFESSAQSEPEAFLRVTPTGQTSTMPGSVTIGSMTNRIARELAAKRSQPDIRAIREAIGLSAFPPCPPDKVIEVASRRGVRVETIELAVEGGVGIVARLFVSPTAPVSTRPLLWAGELADKDEEEIFKLALSGTVVMHVRPRGGNGHQLNVDVSSGYSQAYQTAARLWLVGRNLVEIQVSDLLASALYLRTRPECIGRQVSLLGQGSLGPPAILAACLDPEFANLTVRRSIVSYMDLLTTGFPDSLAGVVIPGVLQRFDLPDALALLQGRKVELVDPIFPDGNAMPSGLVRQKLGQSASFVLIALSDNGDRESH